VIALTALALMLFAAMMHFFFQPSDSPKLGAGYWICFFWVPVVLLLGIGGILLGFYLAGRLGPLVESTTPAPRLSGPVTCDFLVSSWRELWHLR